jgi:hypothetical protein
MVDGLGRRRVADALDDLVAKRVDGEAS